MPAGGSRAAAGFPFRAGARNFPVMETAPIYLVVIDASAESRVALRFATLRAAHVGGRVGLVHVIRPPEFMQWGAVQEAMAAEARAEALALLDSVAAEAEALAGARPAATILEGEPTQALFDHVRGDPTVRALVLGAAPRGAPGPLVSFFTGERAGQLPCVVMVVPGGLAAERLESIT